jgi:hypothetical protein
MTNETRDPRLGAMREILHGWDPLDVPPSPEECRESLALLDTADPIRQVWAEVVGALEGVEFALEEDPDDPEWSDRVRRAHAALSRAREINPETTR